MTRGPKVIFGAIFGLAGSLYWMAAARILNQLKEGHLSTIETICFSVMFFLLIIFACTCFLTIYDIWRE